jgi:hypothetical protein
MTLPEMTSIPMQPSRSDELREAIDQEEARVDRLEGEQADAQTHLVALRSELASLGHAPEIRVGSQSQSPPSCVSGHSEAEVLQ